MRLAPFILAASLAASAAEPEQGFKPLPAPSSETTVADLRTLIKETFEESDRAEHFKTLARTAPRSGLDVQALFDLFQRYPSEPYRRATLESLSKLTPASAEFEPLFLTYLRQPEPEEQYFGIEGAFRLRSSAALPLVREIASRKFKFKNVNDANGLRERNSWWTQYEALEVLAMWEGEKALPLISRKADETPEAAKLLGAHFWRQTLPKMKTWARSKSEKDRDRARRASAASIEPEDAKATYEEMLKIVKDGEADQEVRHRLALKVGMSSDETQAAALVKEHEAAKTERDRLLWASAAFASRRQAAVPLIVRYAREAPEEGTRKGAREQLEDMVGADAAAKLLDDAIKK